MARSKKCRISSSARNRSDNEVRKVKKEEKAKIDTKEVEPSSSNQLVSLTDAVTSSNASELLNLPPEIFQQIMHETICNSGPNEAWKLRATCRTFACEISYNIFAKQPKETLKDFWGYSGHRAAGRGLDQYLFYRTKNPLDARPAPLRKINEIAEYLFHELDVHGSSKQDMLLLELLRGLITMFAEGYWHGSPILSTLWDRRFDERAYHDSTLILITQDSSEVGILLKLAAAMATHSYDLFQKLLNQTSDSFTFQNLFNPTSASVTCRAWPKTFNTFIYAASLQDMKLIKIILQYLTTLQLREPAKFRLRKQYLNSSNSLFDLNDAIRFLIRHEEYVSNTEILQALFDFHRDHFRFPSQGQYSKWLDDAIRTRSPHILNTVFQVPHKETGSGGIHLFKDGCRFNDRKIIDVILDNANINLNDCSILTSPIFSAVRSGSRVSVEAVLEKNPDAVRIRAKSNHRTSHLAGKEILPLTLASHQGDQEIIRCLLENNSPIPGLDVWPRHIKTYNYLRDLVIKLKGKKAKIPSHREFKKMNPDDLLGWKYT